MLTNIIDHRPDELQNNFLKLHIVKEPTHHDNQGDAGKLRPDNSLTTISFQEWFDISLNEAVKITENQEGNYTLFIYI